MFAEDAALIIAQYAVRLKKCQPGGIIDTKVLAAGNFHVNQTTLTAADFISGMSFGRMNGWFQPTGADHVLTIVGHAKGSPPQVQPRLIGRGVRKLQV